MERRDRRFSCHTLVKLVAVVVVVVVVAVAVAAAVVAVGGKIFSHSIYNNSRSTALAAVMLILLSIETRH